ncbi:MAG: biotin transporter BioY [Alcaligenaceae bacterium]
MKTKDIVLIALFTALIVVLSLLPPIPLPLIPVPLTLQTFGVMLAGLILGPARAGLVLLLYVMIALLGLPVLPGGRAGLAVLAGPTAGFLLGMIPGAFVTGWLSVLSIQNDKSKEVSSSYDTFRPTPVWQIARYVLAAVIGGIVLVYAIGIPWLVFVTKMDFAKACWAMAVFVPGDVLKAIVAAVVAQRIRRLNMV